MPFTQSCLGSLFSFMNTQFFPDCFPFPKHQYQLENCNNTEALSNLNFTNIYQRIFVFAFHAYRIVATCEVHQPTVGAFPGLTPNTLQVGRKPKLTALSNLILVYICSTLYCISRQCFSIPCIRFLRDKIRRKPLELQRTYLFINLFKLLDTLRSHCIKHGSRKR